MEKNIRLEVRSAELKSGGCLTETRNCPLLQNDF